MIADFGRVARDCRRLGMPLLAMCYPRGKNVKSQYDIEVVRHCARLAAELGADVVKTNYTGTVESFKEVVKGTPIPVVIAGGPKMDNDNALVTMIHEAMQAGAKGVSIGRNVFQHEDVAGMTRIIRKMCFCAKPEEAACS